ncbi:FAD-linked oxidase [bacterium]|nr:MAG: FAD-linked oxidase [bacterium]
MKTLSGGSVEVDAAALAKNIKGSMIAPTDSGYDEARTIWNAMIDKRPGLIVQCAGAADTRACVNFAREHDLLVSVRGAGHNIAGSSLSDGGLLIDHSLLRSVKVDTGASTVTVEPGATLGDVDAATLNSGLAVPVGINSTTGIAGLTLGGGFGWLSRKHGLTIDALLSADVVTADGQLIHASESEHADLFWALRGGGGNFGVVTSFTYRAYPVGPTLYCGLMVHMQSDAPAVLEHWREFVASAPDELAVWAVLRKAPPLPFLPEEVHGQDVLVLPFVWSGEVDAGEAAIAGMSGFGNPVGMHIGPMPFADFQQAFDPLLTPGARNYWKSHNFTSMSDRTIKTVLEYGATLPSDHSEIFIGQLGGAINRIPADATAYAHRDVEFVLNVHTRWEDASEDEKCVKWAREFFDASAADATGGVYVNFMPEDETDRTGSAFGPNMDRLIQVKEKYDPDNRFQRNQNIRPKSKA